jgi:hypothetical protein
MPVLILIALVFALVPRDAAQERTLTGCLRTGSASSVFVLRSAAASDAVATPSGDRLPEDFLLVAIPAEVTLGEHVNHRIAVTGEISEAGAPPPPPAAANAAEKALKKLSVKSVREVAANCAAAR